MSKTERSPDSVSSHLDEIRKLETKLVGLKRRFLENASAALEQLIGENEAIPFLISTGTTHRFAIPVSLVEEVIEMVAVTRLIEQRYGLLGVFNYHGKLVPLFDLSQIANLEKTEISTENVIIICSVETRFLGVMVSEATDVYMVEKQDIEIADEVLPGAARELGVVKLPDGTAGIIDLWSIVMGIDFEDLERETLSDDRIEHMLDRDDTE